MSTNAILILYSNDVKTKIINWSISLIHIGLSNYDVDNSPHATIKPNLLVATAPKNPPSSFDDRGLLSLILVNGCS